MAWSRLKLKRRRRVYYLRFTAKKIRLGICLECARWIAPGFRRCLVHLRKHRQKGLLCLHCKRPVPDELRSYRHIRVHPACSDENRRRMQRLNWARSERPASYVKSHRAAVKRWQAKQRRLGLCLVCHRKVKGKTRRCRVHAI